MEEIKDQGAGIAEEQDEGKGRHRHPEGVFRHKTTTLVQSDVGIVGVPRLPKLVGDIEIAVLPDGVGGRHVIPAVTA